MLHLLWNAGRCANEAIDIKAMVTVLCSARRWSSVLANNVIREGHAVKSDAWSAVDPLQTLSIQFVGPGC